jgi:hypothetical protein
LLLLKKTLEFYPAPILSKLQHPLALFIDIAGNEPEFITRIILHELEFRGKVGVVTFHFNLKGQALL